MIYSSILGKKNKRAVNAARTKLRAHYFKIFAPSHLSLPLILSHDFMLDFNSGLRFVTKPHNAIPYILSSSFLNSSNLHGLYLC